MVKVTCSVCRGRGFTTHYTAMTGEKEQDACDYCRGRGYVRL